MNTFCMDIIIIGAGAAGLMAGKMLCAAGFAVTILEARERTGGRVHTLEHNGITMEGGAEFIHGNLSLTIELLKEAGISYTSISGEAWEVEGNKWTLADDVFENAPLLKEKLKALTTDVSMEQFLSDNFAGDEHEGLRESVTSYVEGYYAADITRMSALRFYKEWMAEDEQQYRVDGGYSSMIKYLEKEILANGGKIETSAVVKEINWSTSKVDVVTEEKTFTAEKVIITVPIGVLKCKSIKFSPAVPGLQQAVSTIGFGDVIKTLLYFDHAFWLDDAQQQKLNLNTRNISFVFSSERIPTYWTQFPNDKPLLTGWLAGPAATQMSRESDAAILQQAITSLSNIFSIDEAQLYQWLLWYKVMNWPAEPFTAGGYSYSSVGSVEAKKLLNTPMNDTLYFAGEALYQSTETGTVEAALTTGKDVATKIIAAAG